jgi:hypothetical protein
VLKPSAQDLDQMPTIGKVKPSHRSLVGDVAGRWLAPAGADYL